ncbi:GAF domain-containing protein [Massilia sp. UMI-21]|nr:GAF domain-containing protein [Massilia sp. UMI-21]
MSSPSPSSASPSSTTEAQRLRVLVDLNILDSAADERFDRITRLAARLFQVPMAFVSLVDAERLWFKSRVGFPYAETPSDRSFCAHAIRQDDMLVVCDAHADERFADSPFVRGHPQVRFYAGQPLAVGGVHIGTLCLIDSAARAFEDEERALLRDLAGVVANEVAAGALRQAEQRAQRSEAALRALLDHLPDSVLLIDAAGAVVSCNPAAQQLFGLDAALLAGRPAASLLGVDACSLTAAGDLPVVVEASVNRADGALPVEAALSRLAIDGQPHVVASIRDASGHRAALEAERAAEARRRAYFRSAAHELRTPMASILGFSELLLKREFDAGTVRELHGIIHNQSTRLVALINQMLDLARIEAGGPEEQRRPGVDLSVLVGEALAATVPPARADDVAFMHAPAIARVEANPARLRQALAGILENALRFSAPGSRIDVILAPDLRDGRPGLALAVRDRGIGMSPDQRDRMFEAFYRAGEPRTEAEAEAGSGLGLVLVREIVAFHGGSIEVESRPGAGTAVTVWLPTEAGAP